ncbi:peptidoglycan editing factor PgeF [Arcanobacterium phocisimile]|uniref:Purine nucleoside phosphorylase n=1 Tax=Arcanobacterium phocisimile TaxID=1302235 RepID=A0ABX7II15_9ACTO|nr:peptidoglycan editing factor PgeF [Arcanobacterium phocisimile]QRV02778.1 peptidoglycan editing factor PgeF [Arcanobacterium phocisimile]
MADDRNFGISHFFTTVEGGVSKKLYASANLGFHVGDRPDNVVQNRKLLEKRTGVPIVWMEQVHGAHVASVIPQDPDILPTDPYGFLTVGQADGIILERRDVPETGLALAVMVADCVPVLLADRTGSRIAAVHMGRAGMEKEIVGKAVDMFLARGSHTNDISVWFGPHICKACYEVGAELAQQMPTAVRSVTRWGSPGLDIALGGIHQLQERGVSVHISNQCTYESTLYYSHRRATQLSGPTGRFAGIISLIPHDTLAMY